MTGSSPQLRRLGAELRRLREAAGLTQTQVGDAIGRRHTTMVNWEHGNTKISEADLVRLLAELHAPAEVRKGLERLRAESRHGSGQWAVYGLPEWLRPLVSFEEDAAAISTFEPVLVPGLLQTEDYARAIHDAGRRKVAPEYVDRWVQARMQRQERLAGPSPMHLHAIIAEATLRLAVGSPKVLADQLDHLLDQSKSANITIQVLTAAHDGYGGIATNFTLLHFANPEIDPPMCYFDGPLGGHMISDAGDVATMDGMFGDLRRMALAPDESREMLARVLHELREENDHG